MAISLAMSVCCTCESGPLIHKAVSSGFICLHYWRPSLFYLTYTTHPTQQFRYWTQRVAAGVKSPSLLMSTGISVCSANLTSKLVCSVHCCHQVIDFPKPKTLFHSWGYSPTFHCRPLCFILLFLQCVGKNTYLLNMGPVESTSSLPL